MTTETAKINKPVKVHLVDDHRMMVDMWGTLLSQDARFKVTGYSLNGQQLLEEVKRLQPNVVLMDISLPGSSGIELTRLIRQQFPSVRVLAVSMHTNVVTIRQVLLEGAYGFVSKTSAFEEMVEAILSVYNGQRFLSSTIKELLAEKVFSNEEDDPSARIQSLTKRELEIVNLIAEGLSSQKIAEKLFISQRTVEVHRYNIFRKLKVTNALSLIRMIKEESL